MKKLVLNLIRAIAFIVLAGVSLLAASLSCEIIFGGIGSGIIAVLTICYFLTGYGALDKIGLM